MRRKYFWILLGALWAALMALVLLGQELPVLFSSVVAFPFEPLAAGLQTLASLGPVGNGLALAALVGLSLIPALFSLRHIGQREFAGEALTLLCTSAALFLALGAMAAPAHFSNLAGSLLPVGKAVMGGVVWSFVVLWLVLRLVRLLRHSDPDQLPTYLRRALYGLCLLFDAAIALSCGAGLVQALASTQQPLDSIMALLRFACSTLPYVLDIAITLSAISLLDALASQNAAAATQCADRLSRRCVLALVLTAGCTAVLNGVQILFSQWLSTVSVQVTVPIVSLVFLLLILLVSRLIGENQRLRADNELFI